MIPLTASTSPDRTQREKSFYVLFILFEVSAEFQNSKKKPVVEKKNSLFFISTFVFTSAKKNKIDVG